MDQDSMQHMDRIMRQHRLERINWQPPGRERLYLLALLFLIAVNLIAALAVGAIVTLVFAGTPPHLRPGLDYGMMVGMAMFLPLWMSAIATVILSSRRPLLSLSVAIALFHRAGAGYFGALILAFQHWWDFLDAEDDFHALLETDPRAGIPVIPVLRKLIPDPDGFYEPAD